MIDGFELSEHARFQMQERNIQPSWLAQTLSAPIGFCPWPICMATPITLRGCFKRGRGVVNYAKRLSIIRIMAI
jgi:hypothetical protein